ncbi:hypothetical protein L9F63_010142 [Diploptera punctata]|uniref:Connectin n=1 Tax=Diploptera punctata TaxID=6984 RepID=A0AAD8EQG1_DIPPU|nr:hypothetical protein L9F63_010142 [Diploptera punctata]
MTDYMETAVQSKLLLFLLICNTFFVSTSLRQNDKPKSYNLKQTENVCENEHFKLAVQCYCDKQEFQQASDAKCWILSEVNSNDTTWDHFASQSNIKKLKIDIRPKMNLNIVPSRAFQYLEELQMVWIQYANITELPPYTFANLPSLQKILLARNQICDLKPYSFYNLQNLTSVTLDENRIAELKHKVFVDTPNLKKLYINRNILSVIEDRAFIHLQHLEELEIGGNLLSTISRDTFLGLKYLKILNLQDNQLRILSEFIFTELPNLRELIIDRNEIESISGQTFKGLSNLDRLILSENQLKYLDNEVFMDVRNLRFLDIRDNSLHTLNYATVSPIMENLKNVTTYFLIEGNEFICDCHLSWMYVLRNETPNDQIRNMLDELTCLYENNTQHLFDIPQDQLPCEHKTSYVTSSVVHNVNNIGSYLHVLNVVLIFSASLLITYNSIF